MRAIWFILKLLLKILMAPVILSLTLFIWICVGIVYVSGLVLGLISMVVALLGVAVLITYSLQNGCNLATGQGTGLEIYHSRFCLWII